MKAILISIKPKWVAKILNGEKTIEIRKTMPKCDLPIDVYIYVSKNDGRLYQDFSICKEYIYDKGVKDLQYWVYNGKVVAKFTLNKVEEIGYTPRTLFDSDSYYLGNPSSNILSSLLGNLLYEKSCLSKDKLHKYLKGKKGYAWNISNLEIFDKPKELSEFKHCSKPTCDSCPFQYSIECDYHREVECDDIPLTKAPQSWRFVDVGE